MQVIHDLCAEQHFLIIYSSKKGVRVLHDSGLSARKYGE